MNKIKEFFLELFFPCFCLGCKKEGTYLCEDCKEILEISEFQYCLCNKNPLRILTGRKSGKCERCRHKKLSGIYSALPYKEKSLTRDLILKFKYDPYIKGLAKTLAGLLTEHLVKSGKNTEHIWKNSVLAPVPAHKKKLRERSYNQSEELAKELSCIIQVPMAKNSLVKIKKTLPQAGLSGKQREKNLVGAFLIKNQEQISGKKVFLVDDVYTTGSTMEECATQLLKSGAKQVWGIVVAREG
ncbi:MAG: ComF family protein [Candidatus Staskawiczbacteria bacterium]|nr:ComF family protein [Candidatus Staskawiczbacteria bacterium]